MSRGASAPGGGPFIESYIAPDMHMRPVGETVRLIEDAGFEVIDVQAMREHYVTHHPRLAGQLRAEPARRHQILTPEQVRVWRLYLAGGALAFEEGRMGVDQILAVRPHPDPSRPDPSGPRRERHPAGPFAARSSPPRPRCW